MTLKSKVLIVNLLSLSRIIGAFFLPLVFMSVSIPILVMFLIFLFATDFFDGFLARKWSARTIGGSLLDPIGDKLLAVMCILSLIEVHNKLIFLLVLECSIALLNTLRYTGGEKVKSALVGKAKTWALSITLVLASIEHFNPNLLNVAFSLLGLSTKIFLISSSTIDVALYITFGFELATLIIYSSDAIVNHKKKKSKLIKKVKLKKVFKRLFDANKFESDKGKTIIEIINSME